jgi:hypothetical protein
MDASSIKKIVSSKERMNAIKKDETAIPAKTIMIF